jgi:hypothetical protein
MTFCLGPAAGEMYFTTSYDERWNCQHVTTTANPQVADYVGGFRGAWNAQHSCSTDGTNTYFAWVNAGLGGNTSFVWACSCADYSWPNNPGKKQTVTFSSGVPENWDGSLSAIGRSTTGQYIMDIAVQKAGNILFISRIEVADPASYAIWTLNKTTGALLQHNASLGYGLQAAIAVSPTTGELWVVHAWKSCRASCRAAAAWPLAVRANRAHLTRPRRSTRHGIDRKSQFRDIVGVTKGSTHNASTASRAKERDLSNEPDFPVCVWTYARKSSSNESGEQSGARDDCRSGSDLGGSLG